LDVNIRMVIYAIKYEGSMKISSPALELVFKASSDFIGIFIMLALLSELCDHLKKCFKKAHLSDTGGTFTTF